jgi:hypothetical protein
MHFKEGSISRRRLYSYKELIPKKILRVLAAILIAAIIVGSFLPGKEKVWIGTQQSKRAGSKSSSISKKHRLYHFGSFGFAALTLLLLARGVREEIKHAVFIFILGCLIEIIQCLSSRRHILEWWDIRDDLYAIVAIFCLIQLANLVVSADAKPI